MSRVSKPVPPIPFPVARTSPPRTPGGYKELGTSELARTLGVADEALFGHWCRRCEGLWWGLPLEAQCPACGYRGTSGPPHAVNDVQCMH